MWVFFYMVLTWIIAMLGELRFRIYCCKVAKVKGEHFEGEYLFKKFRGNIEDAEFFPCPDCQLDMKVFKDKAGVHIIEYRPIERHLDYTSRFERNLPFKTLDELMKEYGGWQ